MVMMGYLTCDLTCATALASTSLVLPLQNSTQMPSSCLVREARDPSPGGLRSSLVVRVDRTRAPSLSLVCRCCFASVLHFLHVVACCTALGWFYVAPHHGGSFLQCTVDGLTVLLVRHHYDGFLLHYIMVVLFCLGRTVVKICCSAFWLFYGSLYCSGSVLHA